MKYRGLLLLLFFPTIVSFGQIRDYNQPLQKKDALHVYFKVDPDDIPMDYVRTEIPLIDYVRDPGDADVYVILTSQDSGNKGTEYNFFLIGQNAFEGRSDTVTFTSTPDDTQARTLENLVAILKKGLLPYFMETTLMDRVEIQFSSDTGSNVRNDPWKNWVISLYAGGSMRGEKTSQYTNLWGGFSVKKVTKDWKFDLVTDFGHAVNRFDLETGEIISKNSAKLGDALVAWSLNEHWSAGAQLFLGSRTFDNYRIKTSVFPGIEYDIFPYSESARRQIRIMYCAGFAGHIYNDTTIYYKTREFLWGHRLDVAAEMIQEWGSLSVYMGWKNYLHDWSKNNVSFQGKMDLRITKGLKITLSSGVSIIHNQLSLAKEGASTAEILLRQVELETQYSYTTDITLNYTFGSIYQGAVNPRFDNLSRW